MIVVELHYNSTHYITIFVKHVCSELDIVVTIFVRCLWMPSFVVLACVRPDLSEP